ncbi:ATP-dependent DNA helicase RecG [uncultured Aquimonas sp.]|uniref:ATP-dependent DNA helicase RecG n=1 Tax=uncultured Aquimonas sp. TaxID=385483 RepID=UPI00086EF5C1|nr:ATP-dependent DNA helicase RecG [uncultured Aquimonas sp.]ODU44563.1 MAG: ATP-dependent DNA helicase RecG [Xanthomonadaceae bacterium SCN 69-123]
MNSLAARQGIAHAGEASVRGLPGVGPQVAQKLAAAGIERLQDLWFWLPRSYEDRTRVAPIASLAHGERAMVEGRVEAVEKGFRFRPQLKVAISDDSGDTLVLRFFHFHAGQVAQFTHGAWVRCYGEARNSGLSMEMVHPSYRRISESERGEVSERLDPVYPTVEGIGPARLAQLVHAAIDALPPSEEFELLPAGLRAELKLPDLGRALRFVHAPTVGTDLAALSDGRHPARRRLALEELLAHHLSLRRQRVDLRQQGAPPLRASGRLARSLRAHLPFALTDAQERVLGEVLQDLGASEPMLRLVQGDVGSGKTVVAAMAGLHAVEAGAQVALMAPTELLAEQHFNNFRGWLEPLGVEVVWLAGKVKGRARSAALARIAEGAGVVVGTHALMQEGVAFAGLGLAIIDEQHRFGVHQRLALRDKGLVGSRIPHQLVMTATPIPRTLAMTAYADLDVSVIDALPPGRTPVQTVALGVERRPELVERIRAACAEGRQVYWVCTLIEDSDEVQAQAAQTTYEQLLAQLPEVRVALVHGRMKPAEKQAVMQAFKAGELQLLVATTVIEVGVDVPNASLMVIENAERLGLAQLHQLRGRVGRGAAKSSCVLLYQSPLSRLARERLDTLRQTNDGFVIAEKDLELRGPGELLGTRQTGLVGFRIADLGRDADLLPAAQRLADALLADSPERADRVIARWIGAAVRYAGA